MPDWIQDFADLLSEISASLGQISRKVHAAEVLLREYPDLWQRYQTKVTEQANPVGTLAAVEELHKKLSQRFEKD